MILEFLRDPDAKSYIKVSYIHVTFLFKAEFTSLKVLLEAGHSTTDRVQAKAFGTQVSDSDPLITGGIVVCRQSSEIFHMAEKEEVERVYGEAGIKIGVGITEEQTRGNDGKSGLFLHFARKSLGCRLVQIIEATGQVERSLGGIVLSGDDKQLVMAVHNQRSVGGTGIEEILKTTVPATLALHRAGLKLS